MSVSKSFEDDEDDFNESSLIHTRIPGKKVLIFTMLLTMANWSKMYPEAKRNFG